jgi:hypothetical protein
MNPAFFPADTYIACLGNNRSTQYDRKKKQNSSVELRSFFQRENTAAMRLSALAFMEEKRYNWSDGIPIFNLPVTLA